MEERLVTEVIPAICLRMAGSLEKSYSRRISCNASVPFSTMENWLSERREIRRHCRPRRAGGGDGGVGVRKEQATPRGAPAGAICPKSADAFSRRARAPLVT